MRGRQRLITVSQFQTPPRRSPPGSSVAPGPKAGRGWLGRSSWLPHAHLSPLPPACIPLIWGPGHPFLLESLRNSGDRIVPPASGHIYRKTHHVPLQALTQHFRDLPQTLSCFYIVPEALRHLHKSKPGTSSRHPIPRLHFNKNLGETFSPKRFLSLLIICSFPIPEALLGLKQ